MWHGVRAWSSLTFAQIITAVVVNKKSLRFNDSAPSDYADLANRCMHVNPDMRPPFQQALSELEVMCAKHPL